MLEGLTTKTWWKWNETIGPLKDRPGMAGVWNYQVTTGLGLVEYMEWCDDLNMEPSTIPNPPRLSNEPTVANHPQSSPSGTASPSTATSSPRPTWALTSSPRLTRSSS